MDWYSCDIYLTIAIFTQPLRSLPNRCDLYLTVARALVKIKIKNKNRKSGCICSGFPRDRHGYTRCYQYTSGCLFRSLPAK